jgi:hypothetical protein
VNEQSPISFASLCAGVWLGGGLTQQRSAKVANAADRMMWRDIEREFNFKAAMRGKALIKKRASERR